MRGCTLEAKMRTVGRALGLEVRHDNPGPDWPRRFVAIDCDEKFEVEYRLHSHALKALSQLHTNVYRARGEKVYRRQEGKCAMCGKKMPPNAYEIDHKHGRGRGRSDRIEDIQAVCTGFNGCDLHRRKHGG